MSNRSSGLLGEAPAQSRAEAEARIATPGWASRIKQALLERGPALLVGNEWVGAEAGPTAPVLDPSTGEVAGHCVVAGEAAVDQAVRVAQAAQPAWAARDIHGRAECFAALAALIRSRAAEIATVDAIDAGLPVRRMFADIDGALNALRGWPGLASSLRGEVLPSSSRLHYTRYEPFGVVARIVAFNHPFLFAVKGCLAALIAGNTVVLKPADQTPLSALLLGDLIRECFPPGVFNVVTGDASTGAALVSHPLVRRIAFTGSSAVGRLIQQTAARDRVRTVSLELGGKNPMIVFPDAAVGDAARGALFGMNLRANQGQSCGSTSRIFVHRDVYDEFGDTLGRLLAALRLGPAYEPDHDMGPLVSERQADRVRGFIRSGLDSGAQLMTGGLDDPRAERAGFFVAPTLFRDVVADSRIAREEIFGPVISLIPWDDRERMLAAVNDVEYGLTASIWTNDITQALTTADEIEAGYVWVNDSTTHYWGTPFGGWKDSGVGREESLAELLGYLQPKSVHVRLR